MARGRGQAQSACVQTSESFHHPYVQAGLTFWFNTVGANPLLFSRRTHTQRSPSLSECFVFHDGKKSPARSVPWKGSKGCQLCRGWAESGNGVVVVACRIQMKGFKRSYMWFYSCLCSSQIRPEQDLRTYLEEARGWTSWASRYPEKAPLGLVMHYSIADLGDSLTTRSL